MRFLRLCVVRPLLASAPPLTPKPRRVLSRRAAVQSLMEKYDIPYEKIGRLEVGRPRIVLSPAHFRTCPSARAESLGHLCLVNILRSRVFCWQVGTETIIDKSKAVKTTLMQLFTEHGNQDIEGIDTTNACYGGTAAILNSLAWLETGEADGRYAIVITADIAVYEAGPARPTGGCGAVAVLLGPDAPIVFETGTRTSHMADVYDFFKPHLDSEYPEVDGALSNVVYTDALDNCYAGYRRKCEEKLGVSMSSELPAYLLFHCPYCKLVQKSVGRILYNDFKSSEVGDPRWAEVEQFRNVEHTESLEDRDLEKAFLKLSVDEGLFAEKTDPTLHCSRNLGNTYTASLWFCLVSAISRCTDELVGKQLLCFAYGSGLAATMFSLHVVAPVDHIAEKLNLQARLDERVAVSPTEYTQVLAMREQTYGASDFEVTSSLSTLAPGAFYLVGVDEMGRRKYARKDPMVANRITTVGETAARL